MPAMNDKLTPRQNELISAAICNIASSLVGSDKAPEILKEIRRALVSELEAVTSETSLGSDLTVRSIAG